MLKVLFTHLVVQYMAIVNCFQKESKVGKVLSNYALTKKLMKNILSYSLNYIILKL